MSNNNPEQSNVKFLPLTGGELSGNLTVNDTLTVKNYIIGTNPISLKAVNSDATSGLFMQGAKDNTSPQQGYALRTFHNNLMIDTLNNGVVEQGIAQFNNNTNTWDFSTEGLTKNGEPVATENKVLGIGQNWSAKTTYDIENDKKYTNNSSRSIAISVVGYGAAGIEVVNIYVDNILVQHLDASKTGGSIFTIVPPKSTYSIKWTAEKPTYIAILE